MALHLTEQTQKSDIISFQVVSLSPILEFISLWILRTHAIPTCFLQAQPSDHHGTPI